MGIDFKINSLPGFLSRMIEVEMDNKRFWFDVPYGGAMLSEYLQLACLFGSKKNILIGSCGGLFSQLDACDIVIPSKVYGNESSTRMYALENLENIHYPDKDLTKKLKDRLSKHNKVYEGPTITCQAMLAESWEDVEGWSDEGYYGVEMEASTVFAVSNFYKVPASAVLLVADNLIKKETVHHENYEKMREKRMKLRQEITKTVIGELLEEESS